MTKIDPDVQEGYIVCGEKELDERRRIPPRYLWRLVLYVKTRDIRVVPSQRYDPRAVIETVRSMRGA